MFGATSYTVKHINSSGTVLQTIEGGTSTPNGLSFADTPSIKTFFIRPEDVSIYATFVDVFELVADEKRQQVLYKIYKQEKWFGKLKDVIPTFKGELDSKYLGIQTQQIHNSQGHSKLDH